MEYVLQTDALTKIYSKKRVVNNLSLNVKQGEIYGFIGKNGAGKTTLMRMVAGLANPNEGTIKLFGSDDLSKQRVRTGCVIENPALYPNMTAKGNLEFYKILLGIKEENCIENILKTVGLEDTGKKKTKNFSLGMKQRLSIGIALMGNPEFLILDEPINGLDPSGIKEIRELILKLNQEQNITILISSHILGELYKIATCYGIINNGLMIDEFTKDELEQRYNKCIKIQVDDTGKAIQVIENELKTKNYYVLPDGTIELFDFIDNTLLVNQELTKQNIAVMTIAIAGQDLESYFMQLMEGK